MSNANVPTLLEAVRRRLWLRAAGRFAFQGLVTAAVLFAVALLVGRLSGVAQGAWWWVGLGAVPGVAVLYALVWTPRLGASAAASAIDRHLGTKDLFLTACYLDASPGRYHPIVQRQLAEAAPRLRPAAVVPIGGRREAAGGAAIMAVLAAAVLFVPSLDPFGHQDQQRRLVERREQLTQETKLTLDRAQALVAKNPAAELSKPVDQSLDELMRRFNQMKPQDPAGNLRQLQTQRQAMEQLWRQRSQDQLRQALSERSSAQRFGGAQTQQSRQWQEQLAQGDTRGVKKQIDRLRQQVDELAKTKDPAEQQQLRRQIKAGLEQLANAAGGSGGTGATQALQDALGRAMQQLDMASLEGLSQEALEALQQSLALSELELQALAQNMRDLEALQQALQAAQLAQMLNQLQPLDGAQAGQCQGQGMAAYAALYRQLLSQCQGGGGTGAGRGSGSGAGMGGPGRGRGGIAPENESQQTQFQTERSRTAMSAGRMLMQLKTKELAPAGEAQVDYREQVAAVKQGVSEAILQEEVPPGYHDAIRQYFDTIPSSAATGPEPSHEP